VRVIRLEIGVRIKPEDFMEKRLKLAASSSIKLPVPRSDEQIYLLLGICLRIERRQPFGLGSLEQPEVRRNENQTVPHITQ